MSYLKQLQTSQVQASLENNYTYNELSLESQLINSELENLQLTTKIVSIENNGIIDISTESQKEGVFYKIKEFLKGLFKKVIEIGKKIYNFIVGIFNKATTRIKKLKDIFNKNKNNEIQQLSINIARKSEEEKAEAVEKFIGKVSECKNDDELADALREFELPELKMIRDTIRPTDIKSRIISSAKTGLAIQKIKEEVGEKIENLSLDNAGYYLAINTIHNTKKPNYDIIPNEYKRLFSDIGRGNITRDKKSFSIYNIYPKELHISFRITDGKIYTNDSELKYTMNDYLLEEDHIGDTIDNISNYLGNSVKIIGAINKVVADIDVSKLIEQYNSDEELHDDYVHRSHDLTFLSEVLTEALKAKNKTIQMYNQGTTVALRLLNALEGLLKE